MSSPVRRSLILATAHGAPARGRRRLTRRDRPREEATIDDASRGIDVDATTIPELQAADGPPQADLGPAHQFYLQRIKKLNPKLHAVIKVSPTALARRAPGGPDQGAAPGVDLPLLGIPVHRQGQRQHDRHAEYRGSWALAGSTPSDAFIVQRLNAAGAIVIAKANLSEWANFRSIPSSSGWSGIGGQTNMAYVLDRNPCGSSSGHRRRRRRPTWRPSASAPRPTARSSARRAPTGSSGIKPTLGLLSRAGVIPISADQDTAGPMTRNVTDAAVLLGAMTGIDPKDAATAAQAGHAFTDYTQFLDADALDGARIGIWRSYDPKVADPATVAIFEDTVDDARGLGATIVDPVSLDLRSRLRREFAGPAVRVQDRHRDVPRRRTRRPAIRRRSRA